MKVVLIVVIVAWLLMHDSDANSRCAFKVIAVDGHTAVIRPYVAPAIDVDIRSGKPEGAIDGCQQVTEQRRFQDHVETVVTLKCAHGVVLEVKGLHLQ